MLFKKKKIIVKHFFFFFFKDSFILDSLIFVLNNLFEWIFMM